MEISKQLCKPQNWQDFESLCKILWTHVWELNPGDVKKNGRMGQAQHGVDVYGKPKECNSYIHILAYNVKGRTITLMHISLN